MFELVFPKIEKLYKCDCKQKAAVRKGLTHKEM